MEKTLYFEGAGWSGSDNNGVGNCRIRTAFHLDDGRRVYLEMLGHKRTKYNKGALYAWEYVGFIDSAFYITDEKPNDDENRHQIPRADLPRSFEWSLPEILRTVNSLGASFDAVQVVPDFGGFRVFRDACAAAAAEKYNFGDEFIFDAELTRRRAEAVARMEEINAQRLGMKYDNSSYWIDESGALVMRINASSEALRRAGLTERKYILLEG